MKKLFFAVLLLFTTFAITQTVFSLNGNSDEQMLKVEREYLDLTKDAVNPNGVSAEKERQLLASGWVKRTLSKDLYVEGVQFKNASGNFYTKNGWLKSGTEYYLNMQAYNDHQDGDGLLRVCENVYTHWRWMNRLE
ncbi:MAG: hypothetical protein IPL33_20875 [Sphingobacteriales bacterium]|nr:hypothetical protein [Sphingobacteriales bacterium]